MKFRFPKKNSHRAAAAAGLVLVLLLVVWTMRPDPPPALATSEAVLADIEQTVVATGVIEARELVSVGAQASGQITSLAVELGDEVKAGDLIAEIDATTQQNALRNAEAALSNIRAQRASQVATLRQAEAAFARQETMLEAEATSQADYESARAVLASARALARHGPRKPRVHPHHGTDQRHCRRHRGPGGPDRQREPGNSNDHSARPA